MCPVNLFGSDKSYEDNFFFLKPGCTIYTDKICIETRMVTISFECTTCYCQNRGGAQWRDLRKYVTRAEEFIVYNKDLNWVTVAIKLTHSCNTLQEMRIIFSYYRKRRKCLIAYHKHSGLKDLLM